MNKINSVCVYCASSTKIDSVYFDAARELGTLLGQRQIRLINGAGNMGLMSAVSDAALWAGGEVTGVIPRFMVEQGWHHTGLTQLVEVESMHQRKKTMADLSDAVIALPGGCGTLEELLDDIKANPGKVTMSHSGPGGSGHNQGLVLKELGYDVAMTSFDSGNDALLGVIGGQVDFTNPNISTLGGYIERGDVTPLAVFSNERMEAYPDIPSFTVVVPESEKYLNIPYTLLSFVVNNDTPQEVVAVFKAATKKVFADTDWTAFVKQNAADPVVE